jgi:hypothetical protein
MQLRELWTLSERWLGRFHLLAWLADLGISVISGVVSGYLGRIDGWEWVFVIFIAIGATVIAFVVMAILILGLSWFFVGRLIPLHIVARRIYEKFQGSPMGAAAESKAKTPDAILDFFADFIITATGIYAKRLPSTKYTHLRPEQTQGLRSTHGAKNLYETKSHTIIYGSPRVRRADIKRAIGFVEVLGQPI